MKLDKGKNQAIISSFHDSNSSWTPDDSFPEDSNDSYRSSQSELLINIAYDYAPILVLIVNEDFRIEKINRIGLEKIGKNSKDVLGFLGGDIFSCINSHNGNGCGTTPACGSCFIRNLVTETLRTGMPFHKAEGTLDILCDDNEVSQYEVSVSTAYVDLAGCRKVILYFDDVTACKNAERTLKESEERFQIMYENVPGGTMIIGKDYVIEDVNQRTCEITGYKKEELIGQLCDIVCPKGSLSKKCPIWVDGLDGFQSMDTAIKCKDGTRVSILKNAKKISMDGNTYILENFQDISERKEAEEAVINAMITAEEANRTKSEFLATMSHELRTPLNAVIGYSDLLLEDTFGSLSQDQKRFIGHISHSGKHLLGLINDILDLSKVESGKMELHYEQLCVTDMFGNVLNIVSPLARIKNMELRVSVTPDNLLVSADRIRFKQIMYNLVSNAVKFTPEGGRILLEAYETDNALEFAVTDTGIGISSEDISKLFLPFQQIDSTMSRKYEGTGLGLSLVKKLVEMHGGDISVRSSPGEGSKFSFRLPVNVLRK